MLLYFIYLLKGGGTLVLISGLNLGSSINDLASVSIQCGTISNTNNDALFDTTASSSSETVSSITKCDIIANKYVPSKQIVCRTRASTSGAQNNCKLFVHLKSSLLQQQQTAASVPIMNIQISNNQQVRYVDPLISEIRPSSVIQSANFVWLSIRGFDLDAGRTRHIEIVDYYNTENNQFINIERRRRRQPNDYYQDEEENQQPHQSQIELKQRLVLCDIKNVTANEIRCRLNDKFATLGHKSLRITYDNGMSIVNSRALTVNSDPIVSSISKVATVYSGGTRFNLSGTHFGSVQSAYVYVAYNNMWYSAPVLARIRHSVTLIEFEYPPLNTAFFELVKQQQYKQTSSTSSLFGKENYELQIGFLMDGFNVTLSNVPIVYVADYSAQLISVKQFSIAMSLQTSLSDVVTSAANNINSNKQFSLIVDMQIDKSIIYSDLIRDDLSIYVACSPCTQVKWLNETRFSCVLPSISVSTHQTTTANSKTACEPKAFNAMLSKLNAKTTTSEFGNAFSMVNMFIGNMLVSKQASAMHDEQNNENLKIYLRTYALNGVDAFASIAEALLAHSSLSSDSIQSQNIDLLLLAAKNSKNSNANSIVRLDENDSEQHLINSLSDSTRNMLLVAAIVAVILSN